MSYGNYGGYQSDNWQWGGNWFRKTRRNWFDSWRPRYIQPDAAALEQDSWTQRQGRVAYEGCATRDNPFDDQVDAADFFSTCFEPLVVFAKKTSRPKKAYFIQSVLSHPMFAALRASTRLEASASHVAAQTLAEFYRMVGEEPGAKGKGNSGQSPNGGQGSGELSDEEKQQIQGVVNQVMTKAQNQVEDAQQLGEAFGTQAGTGIGTPSDLDVQNFLKMYAKYRNNHTLKNMIRFAGRMRHIMRAKMRAKTRYGSDQFAGVEIGDSIERLIPDEMGTLDVEHLDLEILSRIAEGEAQIFEPCGSTIAGLGPIILAVDESGSMAGTKYEQAMGIALTIAWVARKQRRWVGLYTFQDGPETRKLILDPSKPGDRDSGNLLSWVTSFAGGGTDATVVTQVIPKDVRQGLLGKVRGKADLLVISDGCFDGNVGQGFLDWKKEFDIKVKGLIVGTNDAGALQYLADENVFAKDMSENSKIAEAVFDLA